MTVSPPSPSAADHQLITPSPPPDCHPLFSTLPSSQRLKISGIFTGAERRGEATAAKETEEERREGGSEGGREDSRGFDKKKSKLQKDGVQKEREVVCVKGSIKIQNCDCASPLLTCQENQYYQ